MYGGLYILYRVCLVTSSHTVNRLRSKFCFWAGTWDRDVGTSPGFRSPRVTEDPARKPKVRPNFFLDRDQFIGWKWISFVPESGRVGYESRSTGWGTGVGRSFVSGQGHGSGCGDVLGISVPPGDRGPCKKTQLRPNFFLGRDQFMGWKWISFLSESGRVGYESRSTGWGTGIGRSFVSGQGHEVGIWGRPRDFGPNWVRDKLSALF
jgi:hypothetical protein